MTMEWPGQLLLKGYRIFEANNNDRDAVNEEGNSIQDQEVQIEVEEGQEGCEDSITSISSLLKSDAIEAEVGDGAAGANLSRGQNFASTSGKLSVEDDWCEDRENRGKRISGKNHLSPVVRLLRLDERSINAWAEMNIEESENVGGDRRGSAKSHLSPVVKLRRLGERGINFWAEVDIEEEQDDSEGSESGGSILKKGLKFSSADDYLSFMEEERPEVDAALQPSVEGMNYVFAEAGVGVEQGNREEVGSLGGGRTSKGEIV